MKMLSTSNFCFWLEYNTFIHNSAFSILKVLVGREIWRMWEDNRGWTFSMEDTLLCFMDYCLCIVLYLYFSQKQHFEVKNVLMMHLFITNMQLLIWHDDN